MKISTNLLFDRATQQMGKVQSDLAKTQAQIASGKQVVSPSDAPDKAAAVERLRSLINRQDSYAASAKTIQSRLQSEDATLGSVSDLVVRVKELAVQAASDTLGPTDRKALAIEMTGLRDQILSLANTQDSSGNYMFSGSRVQDPAFAPDDSGSVIYKGDQTRVRVAVGDQRSVQVNRSGSDAFVRVVRVDAQGQSAGVGFFQVLDQLTAAVQSSDRTGIERGVGEVDALQNGLSGARAQVGTDLNVMDSQTNVLDETKLSLQGALSSVEDLDYTQAITLMSKQKMSLEAAQSSFAKISQLSLFNFIK